MWNNLRAIRLDTDNLRPNLEYGKKNVKAARIIETALTHPYHHWDVTVDSEPKTP